MIGYVLGFIFCNKPLTLLINLVRNLRAYGRKLEHFLKSWNDWLFIGLIALIAISFLYFFGKSIKLEDKIQTLIVIGTFSSVVFATIIKNNATQYRNRPIINVEFDDNDPNCYHLTDMHINIGGQGVATLSIPTYYIHLKIVNEGEQTLENTEVILENVEPKPEKFMSLNLNWAGFIVPIPNDIQRTARLPQKQSRILDLIEVMKPEPTSQLASSLSQSQNLDAERYKSYSEGFRSCSIKPNTLSDIYPADKYTFHLGVYADNAEPKHIKIVIDYDGKWDSDSKAMKTKHLKIRLLK